MKKTFLIFLITFSFLVGFNKVLAYSEEVSPMYTYSSDITILSPWTEEQEQIAMNYVNNNCQSYSNYLLSSVGIGSSYGDIAIYVYCFNGDYSYLATSLRNYNGKSDSNYIYPYPNSDSKLSGIRSMLKTDNTWYRTSETFSTSSRISKNTNEIPMLKSNLDGLYLDNTGGTGTYYQLYNSVKYNDLIYNIGDKFYDLENSKFATPDNVFQEVIYTTDYNSLEFKFDLASLPLYSEGNNFNLDFTFKSVTQDGKDETIKFSLPYYTLTKLVESTTEEGASVTLTKESIEEYFKQDNYFYTYSNSEKIRYLNDSGIIEKNYTKYKITLPLEFSYASFVEVYLKSNVDFEVVRNYSSNYDETIESDIKKIDLTNKYGVVFIPLVKNGTIHFPFKSVGHFFVQHRDTYNENFNILSTTTVGYCDEYHKNDDNYICSDLSGLYSFTFKEGFENQILTFINRNYENETNSFVEYHSNSFNYCILDTPTSSCGFVNPNTEEEVDLTLKDYFDYKTESNNESFFTIFSNAFDRFKTSIFSIFDFVSIYFENLPSILKDFYIVIFVFVLLAIIIKFII